MGKETIIKTYTESKTARSARTDVFTNANTVRVYKSAPDRVTLQIRHEKLFSAASMNPEQVEELRDALQNILAELSAPAGIAAREKLDGAPCG